ncbi:hypothetical protein BE21_22245 [Sorangium cellulosum]|uniref:Uncharacterized protein n=1 Tax=Sorangium cellulosum TaxID=56 RepID=A0A150TVJ0_SORCE|nr:hypothetical protein BE21_22245 [Sorangium cellulosum]
MSKVNFGHAFERWYKLTDAERKRFDDEQKRGTTPLYLEALDHLCGLAVESGMKALMFAAKLEKPDAYGDFPKNPSTGRRPHVDELWDIFIAKASGRKTSAWVPRLGGRGTTPANVFQTWRAETRYAPDGTISEGIVRVRLEMAKRLKSIAEEEGL